jgi:STE24 endopeptidase
MAFWLAPLLGPTVADIVSEASWLRLLAMAAILGVGSEIITFPIAYWSGFVLEHRYQLSTQTFRAWLWKRVKGYIVGGILGSLLLLGLYGVLWTTGSLWWLWATAGWLLVSLVLGRLMPVLILPLFYKVTRLDDAGLLERLRHLADGTGLTVEGVYRLHLSQETRKANAALAGLGKTRRVLLGDTLLEQFTPAEIDVVFAHEIGHHVYRHLPKMIAVSVFLALAGFWLVDVALTSLAVPLGYAGMDDPIALPLVLFVLSVFGLVLSPAENALSRFFEVQCDRYALLRTGNREAYRAAFIKLARLNKSDPDPHPLAAWLFYDHPPIRQRLALVDRY